jgi:hypothetical protein
MPKMRTTSEFGLSYMYCAPRVRTRSRQVRQLRRVVDRQVGYLVVLGEEGLKQGGFSCGEDADEVAAVHTVQNRLRFCR